MSLKERVEKIARCHAQKASESPYDTKVAIVAVGAAQHALNYYNYTGSDLEDLDGIVSMLTNLRDKYNDTSGEYTSGKGEIGSLMLEISRLKSEFQVDSTQSETDATRFHDDASQRPTFLKRFCAWLSR